MCDPQFIAPLADQIGRQRSAPRVLSTATAAAMGGRQTRRLWFVVPGRMCDRSYGVTELARNTAQADKLLQDCGGKLSLCIRKCGRRLQ